MKRKVSSIVDWYTFWSGLIFLIPPFYLTFVFAFILDSCHWREYLFITLLLTPILIPQLIICIVNRRKISFEGFFLNTLKDHFYRQKKARIDLSNIESIELTFKWDEKTNKYQDLNFINKPSLVNRYMYGIWSNHPFLKFRTSFFLRDVYGGLFILHTEAFTIKQLHVIEKTILSINPNIKVIVSVDDIFGKKKGPDSQSKFPLK